MTDFTRRVMRSAWQHARRPLGAAFTPVRRRLAAVWHDTSAITSLEYALVGFPFFAMILATFAIGLWYFYAASVDIGVYLGGRSIMTGQFQGTTGASSMTAGTFTTTFICPQMPAFIPCSATNPAVNMTAVYDFSQLVKMTPVPPPPATALYYTLSLKPLTPNFCVPMEGDTVYLQAQYKMPNIFGFFGLFNITLTSGTTVQVEPFPAGVGTSTLTC